MTTRRVGRASLALGLAAAALVQLLGLGAPPLYDGVVPVDPDAIAAAAVSIDLPDGSLPNGAGLRFSTDPTRLGQNERSSAVIWQWQGVGQSVTVWPPVLATGSIAFVPLPR